MIAAEHELRTPQEEDVEYHLGEAQRLLQWPANHGIEAICHALIAIGASLHLTYMRES
jgi:hypothetical protein